MTVRRSGLCVSAYEKIFSGPTYIGELQPGKTQHFLALRLRLETFSGLNLQLCHLKTDHGDLQVFTWRWRYESPSQHRRGKELREAGRETVNIHRAVRTDIVINTKLGTCFVYYLT